MCMCMHVYTMSLKIINTPHLFIYLFIYLALKQMFKMPYMDLHLVCFAYDRRVYQ